MQTDLSTQSREGMTKGVWMGCQNGNISEAAFEGKRQYTDQEDIRHPRQVENNTREATSGVRKSHRVRSQPRWLEDYDTSTST